MFISAKRHEREKQELRAAGNRLIDAILASTEQGLFMIDAQGRLQAQVSHALGPLLRRASFADATFPELIVPLVSVKTLAAARAFVQSLVAAADPTDLKTNPLKDTEMRLPNADGSFDSAHYAFDFQPVEGAEPRLWLVRITDITLRVQSMREADELRSQLALQGEILRSVLQAGPARFAAFLQRTDASMKRINTVLKKPARAEDAFRAKLEETLEEVDRIRRDAAALKLGGIEGVARQFEDSLHELRSRTALSGSDFLPLAVKLDHLYGQFVALRTLTASAGPARAEEPGPQIPHTANGTQIIESPKFLAERAAPRPVPGALRSAPAGSLENTLRALCEHVAQEHSRNVTLECQGLTLVPSEYQATIKNVAIQLIRNAVMHGIESAEERAAARKPATGALRLEFKILEDRGYELLFEDDGRGLNPDQVRAVAIERGVITGEMAARLRDREAIKLIFKSGYSTLPNNPGEPPHGSGMSLVRRYVHEAGGKIALASLLGHETRFKVSLPALPASEKRSLAAVGATQPAR